MKLGPGAKSVKEMTLKIAERLDPQMEALYEQYPELRPDAEEESQDTLTTPQNGPADKRVINPSNDR